MKRFFLFMVALFLGLGCVSALNGKILVGGNVGYTPELKVTAFEANARWRMDYDTEKNFTADIDLTAGIVTDFKGLVGFNSFFGAGLTKEIADRWDVFGSAGLDVTFGSGFRTLGVAVSAGFEYELYANIFANCQVKLSQYFPGGIYTFKPSIGCSYAF